MNPERYRRHKEWVVICTELSEQWFRPKIFGGLIMRTPESPDWDKEEYRAEKAKACSGCNPGGYGPSHDGSVACESGSIASGGTRSHCTCDVCF